MARMALPPSDLRQAIATRKESYTNLTSLDATSHGELHEVARHIQPSCRTRRHTWFRERNSIAHISSHCTSTHARARAYFHTAYFHRRDEHTTYAIVYNFGGKRENRGYLAFLCTIRRARAHRSSLWRARHRILIANRNKRFTAESVYCVATRRVD